MNLWYVVQTKAKKEGEATSYLSTKGLEVFNPLTEDLSTRNGRMEKVLKSLFPNYVFVKFDLNQSYNLVR
jgi:transcription antitermination factor NusG